MFSPCHTCKSKMDSSKGNTCNSKDLYSYCNDILKQKSKKDTLTF